MVSMVALFLLMIVACTQNDEQSKGNIGSDTQSSIEMILATTTSTQDSGLLDVLIPLFEEKYNIRVKTIAVGTGQALAMAEQGEADALLTHAPAAEIKLVESQHVINRKRVMYNDFIIVGPQTDPAGIYGASVVTALQTVYETGATFVSRGDDSGTHKMELSLWATAELDPVNESWYLETGQGMGNTLRLSAEKEAYVLTDRATYLAHTKNFDNMTTLVEGDDVLLNIYHVMQVNAQNHSLVNGDAGLLFVEFMVGEEAQAIVRDFGLELYGQPLFTPYTE
jgi:tungstate transport system substrate-binding protein